MTRPSNQEIEKHYFRQFQAHFRLPPGRIEHRDKPDVVIHGERLLGIEIANLYLTDGSRPQSEQVQRRRREAVVQAAQKQHLLEGGKNIELAISFNPAHPITDVAAVAKALAVVAQANQNRPSGMLPRKRIDQVPQLELVHHNPVEYVDSKWTVSQVFGVPNLSTERVLELVAAKERLLAGYMPCDAFWLLLIVDYVDPAQDQEIGWPVDQPALKTVFERVIVYRPQLAHWTEVPVER